MRHNRLILAILALFIMGNTWATDDWKLKDMNGKTHTLPSYHGKWVLVNFWATWCPSCVAEISAFNRLQQIHQKDLVIIGIAEGYRDSQEVLSFMREMNIVYPVVLGNEDTAGDFGGLSGFPTSFLYSPSGKLVDHHEGPMTQDDIEQKMR